MLQKKIDAKQFQEVADYIKGFSLLLLKKLRVLNNDLIMLNNFDLKTKKFAGSTRKRKTTGAPNFVYDSNRFDSVMNSNFAKIERTRSGPVSRQSGLRNGLRTPGQQDPQRIVNYLFLKKVFRLHQSFCRMKIFFKLQNSLYFF